MGGERDSIRDDARRGQDAARATRVWGVLNVTPDSFSDGGQFVDVQAATRRALEMRSEGASVIDVGGASSRPPGATYGAGASEVSVAEEIDRVVPVIEAITVAGMDVSVDTTRAEVAQAALDAGASIVNDVSGGACGLLLELVAARGVQLVLMHTRDGGRVDAQTTDYPDLVGDVLRETESMAERAVAHGVDRDQLWIDPGIGFAKTAAQNAQLLGNLDAFVETGYPVLVGASRKSFIARLGAALPDGELAPPSRRLGGSLAAVSAAAWARCAAVRVHDVFESAQAVSVTLAMRGRA
ncbi:MAG: dihydropteroate synthase [Sandaracinaceae bacterium]